MSRKVRVTEDRQSVTVHVPLQLRKRGGRKMIIGEVRPTTSPCKPPVQSSEHQTILKALGRAYRWKRMLDSGEFASIADLAKAEKINDSYVRRLLRLTLFSPEITEQILRGQLAGALQVEDLLKSIPEEWAAQCSTLAAAGSFDHGHKDAADLCSAESNQ